MEYKHKKLSERLTSLSLRQLILAAAVFHFIFALSIFVVGRSRVAPSFIDRDGIMPSFAFDSYEYQKEAIDLSSALRHGSFGAWLAAAQPPHVKLISICFVVLGPLFGPSTLSAEPLNLLCYLLLMSLVFALGREVGGRPVGLFSAAIVGTWPTLLLHSLQLLKDPLFIAGALAIVLFVTTLLTKTYSRRADITVGAAVTIVLVVMVRVRASVAFLTFGVLAFGISLLMVRQAIEKRWRPWNIFSAAPALLVAVTVSMASLSWSTQAHSQSFKHSLPDQSGTSKSLVEPKRQIASFVVYRPYAPSESAVFGRSQLGMRVNTMALAVGRSRARFSVLYPNSGSILDENVDIRNFSELMAYLPRALEIGLWAPFPNSWLLAGNRVGSSGRLLAGFEMLTIYLFEIFALVTLIRFRRELPVWLLAITVLLGVTTLALLVPNVGALYRFRYAFWILLTILAAKGIEFVVGGRRIHRRTATLVASLAVIVGTVSCSSHGAVAKTENLPAQSLSSVPANRHLGFELVNFTGVAIHSVYLSRSDSASWEENILAASKLEDGQSVDIQFSAEEHASQWDLRVEGSDGRYAQWSHVNLWDAAKMILVLKSAQPPAVVAEIEQHQHTPEN